jgi:ankyrin repeat protein
MLRVLLEAGGSLTAQGGPKSSTPLHLAARFGHISAVDCIVKTPIELEERLVRAPAPLYIERSRYSDGKNADTGISAILQRTQPDKSIYVKYYQ